jgi:hypothetical protein
MILSYLISAYSDRYGIGMDFFYQAQPFQIGIIFFYQAHHIHMYQLFLDKSIYSTYILMTLSITTS